MCSSSQLSRTFGIHSFSFPHLAFSLLWERLSCAGEWSARSSTEANLEMRGSGQLSPFSKQQTTCPRPDLCVCLRGGTSTLDKNLLHVLCLAQRGYLYSLRCKDLFCVPNMNPLRDGQKLNTDVRLQETNFRVRLICQQICPEISSNALCLVTTCCEASTRRAYPGSHKPRWTEINTLSSSTMLTQIKWKIHRDVKQRKTKTTKWMHRL